MDIKSINQNTLNNRVGDAPGNQARGNASASAKNDAADKVTLTDMSSQVADLEKKAAASEIDNSEKIAELKAAIQEGSYQVDANKVASKLIQTEALFSS